MTTTAALQAVTDLFDAMSDAWNRADSDAYGELFATDADFVEIRGGRHLGRDAIAQGHRAIWDTVYVGSEVTYQVEHVRALDDRHAVGVVAATLQVPAGPLAGTMHARMTAVVAEEDDRWRIVSFHNTRVVGESGSAGATTSG